MKAFVSGDEVVGHVADESELEELVRAIPCGWVIWMCSVLERLSHQGAANSVESQQRAVEELLVGDQKEIVSRLVAQGQIFVHEEQLLVTARFAIEHASDDERTPTPEERQRFGALLIGTNDLLSSEGPRDGAGRDEFTAFGLRSLAFQSGQVFWHLIGRGYAYWREIPPLLKDSTNYVDVGQLFADATGAPLDAFFTAAIAALTRGEQALETSATDPTDQWSKWTFTPSSLVGSPTDPDGLRSAWETLAADRASHRALFASMPGSPRYAGVAMDPFRRRPIFRFASGNCVVLSTRYLIEAIASGVFWRIADHVGKDPKLRDRFTRFAGEIHQRYVFELMRSAFDFGGHRRVYGDDDARPQLAERTPSSADALAFLSDYSIFAEATITSFRYGKTILPADLAEFDADIKRTIVHKTLQLEDAIRDYRWALMRYDPYSDAASLGKTIWPILVLRDPLPTFFLLKERVDALLRDAGAGKVDPSAFLLSTEELELLLRDHDDGRVRRLLTEWRNDSAYQTESFRNFYLERYPDERGSVPYLKSCLEGAFNLVRRQMGFPERKPDWDSGDPEATTLDVSARMTNAAALRCLELPRRRLVDALAAWSRVRLWFLRLRTLVASRVRELRRR